MLTKLIRTKAKSGQSSHQLIILAFADREIFFYFIKQGLEVGSYGKNFEKGENASKQPFLPFPQCFLPFQVLISSKEPNLFSHRQMFLIFASIKFCQLVKG